MGFHILPLVLNRWAAFLHDLAWVPLALLLAFMVRLDFQFFGGDFLGMFLLLLALSLPVQAVAYMYFGLYRGIWRFASVPDLMRILRAVWVGAATTILLLFLLRRVGDVPRAVLLVYPVFLTMGLTAPRLFYRWFKDHFQPKGSRRRALIVGAGWSGDLLVRELIKSREYLPVGFLDDDPRKLGRDLHGVPVLGSVGELDRLLRELDVEMVLIAMPTADARLMRRIVDVAAHEGVACVTLPSLRELADGRVEVSRLREVEIDDLLGREVITLDDAGLHAFLEGKRVLVTGAGGSIGSELCRQVAQYGPERVVMLDHAEYGLYSIERDMQRLPSPVDFTPVLGDVTDAVRMREVFASFRPDIVLHAAAYKHVPLLEDNAVEGVKVNVLGTRMVADLAATHGCEKFVLVSTDKAVRPTNVMGASKRVAELYCQSVGEADGTAFMVTRFGNVMGSAGSVVPLFRRQIAEGGPVTVTHPDITRYFMTIPEAVSLILQAASMGAAGEVFVLDMGKPIRIRDLAEEMIRLSGHEPGRDIDVAFIGLRPGEKLHEELFHEHENPVGTSHPKILRAEARKVSAQWLVPRLGSLQRACAGHDEPRVQGLLKELVPEFRPAQPAAVPTPEFRPAEPATVALKVVGGTERSH
ncbi:UDP-N-acetylglucosamine 4,6-dehydratase [Thioalkalivibrio nitratireducens DSM 14787]|uniref:UDP-N-acetylglucosamine 4,6-dehydratase n=1 Tax=Thioalkalivibrio nitratireducens (strain DSM 14787 / UNIQEM 213 / ALEN2) TaxID=1255043 RepID=L0DX69_THIND|nr:nucleoside-diphosphate sugar epimerase/dehydratase [Thioalkalivibrio nitratireducens]AGA33560.1 UDP-N-acetylglucosamine 4,6-dehydratase [Thioalkalivibrio nitratireducens DSM 14787]